ILQEGNVVATKQEENQDNKNYTVSTDKSKFSNIFKKKQSEIVNVVHETNQIHQEVSQLSEKKLDDVINNVSIHEIENEEEKKDIIVEEEKLNLSEEKSLDSG